MVHRHDWKPLNALSFVNSRWNSFMRLHHYDSHKSHKIIHVELKLICIPSRTYHTCSSVQKWLSFLDCGTTAHFSSQKVLLDSVALTYSSQLSFPDAQELLLYLHTLTCCLSTKRTKSLITSKFMLFNTVCTNFCGLPALEIWLK